MTIDFNKLKTNAYQPCEIIEVVSNYYNISKEDIVSSSRLKDIVKVRKYACYMLVRFCKKNTLLELAKYLGYYSNGSHATVLFHYQDLIKKVSIYGDVKTEIESLERACELHFENLTKMYGFTIEDAIKNPDILEFYKK